MASLTFSTLPQPDRLEGALTSGSGVLIVGDRSNVSFRLAHELASRGVRVAWLSPAGTPKLDTAVYSSDLPSLDENAVSGSFAVSHQTLGCLDCVVYFQPHALSGAEAHQALEMAFLFARASQPYLTANQHTGRPAFVSVTRMDGMIGLSSQNTADPVNAGLFGLVRSLSQEWPQVFCRAIDISPEVSDEECVSHILVEIEDADPSLVEVGISPHKRQTPAPSAVLVELK